MSRVNGRLGLLLVLLLWLLAGPLMAELRVVVISDLNGRYGSTEYRNDVNRAIRRIVELKPDLVISTGDMIAGQRPSPLLKKPQLQRMWEAFHDKVTAPLAAEEIPLAVTPGNHDASAYGRYHLERELYSQSWRKHRPSLRFLDDRHYPFHYAFEMEGVMFISLDATANGRLEERQKRWLEQLFEEHGKSHPRKIAFGHLPIWPFAQKREKGAMFDAELEELLRENGVELYLSGHHHAFYPGYKDGLHHLSQACLGAGPRKLIGDDRVSPRSFTLLEIPARGDIGITAYGGRRFDRPVEITGLPERIVTPAATLIRRDLVPQSRTVNGKE